MIWNPRSTAYTKQQKKFQNPIIQIISDLNSKINSPDQATKEISKPNNKNNQWFEIQDQQPIPSNKRNFETQQLK